MEPWHKRGPGPGVPVRGLTTLGKVYISLGGGESGPAHGARRERHAWLLFMSLFSFRGPALQA